jgi:Mrp family chromosome partitioning ATPase
MQSNLFLIKTERDIINLCIFDDFCRPQTMAESKTMKEEEQSKSSTNDSHAISDTNRTSETGGTSISTPSNANEGCVGPQSSSAGQESTCAGCPNQQSCSKGEFNSAEAQAQKMQEEVDLRNGLQDVTHIVLVLSGKGGVGKSTVACQVAQTLATRGYTVGVLDIDICGPSTPHMLGVVGREVKKSGSGWTPVYVNENLSVMSVAFLLPDNDAAVIWRGPRKNGLIKQFLTETDWGNGEGLDYLIVDTPPGTSDEHISTVQYLKSIGGVSGSIVVSTPEEVSMADVRKELNFCKKTSVPVIGVVENMATFRAKLTDLQFVKNINSDNEQEEVEYECTSEVIQLLKEKCPEVLDLTIKADMFAPSHGGPRSMAEKFNVPFLGSLPLDPNLLKACEDGLSFVDHYPDSSAARPLNEIVDNLVKALPITEESVVDDIRDVKLPLKAQGSQHEDISTLS